MNTCKTRSFLSSLVGNHAQPRSTRTLTAFLSRLVEDRHERDQTGLFFCDGLRTAFRIADSPHFSPALFVYSPDLLHRQPGVSGLLERLRIRHPTTPQVTLPTDILCRLSMSPEPQGFGAVVEQAWTPLYRLPPNAGLCYLVVDTVRNAGNLGTVLRTLEAVGGSGLICLPPEDATEPTVDPFAPGVVRATMGATFSLRFARGNGEPWDRWRQKNEVTLIGTSPHTGEDYRTVRYGERVALWIGSERKGLSETQMAKCDRLVRIPMAPTATSDSLNFATATSVLLYELFNQRTPVTGSLPV